MIISSKSPMKSNSKFYCSGDTLNKQVQNHGMCLFRININTDETNNRKNGLHIKTDYT